MHGIRFSKFVWITFFVLCALPVRAENVTALSFSCAPWDGRSFIINVHAPDTTYNVTIWGAGLETLRTGGHKLDIDNAKGSSSEGNGRAEICGPNNRCQPQDMSIEFEAVDLRVGGKVKGLIQNSVPFEGIIASAEKFCG